MLLLMRAMSQPAHLCSAEQYTWRMQYYFDNMGGVSSFSSPFNKDWERGKRMEEGWRAEQSHVPARGCRLGLRYAAASASPQGFYLVVVGILLAQNQKTRFWHSANRFLFTYRSCLLPAEK